RHRRARLRPGSAALRAAAGGGGMGCALRRARSLAGRGAGLADPVTAGQRRPRGPARGRRFHSAAPGAARGGPGSLPRPRRRHRYRRPLGRPPLRELSAVRRPAPRPPRPDQPDGAHRAAAELRRLRLELGMAGLRITIVGSGFAGSILARILQLQGHRVLLLDRHRHPRFALGESSTPLAAICLERLATRYGLDDLHALAAWGRWRERLPHLRRGLKRGFTFYGHSPGRPFTNERRLLVAASPDDGVADTHWLRADVDEHLAKQAEAVGVE